MTREEAEERARELGHELGPWEPEGDPEAGVWARCTRELCLFTVHTSLAHGGAWMILDISCPSMVRNRG